MGRVVATEGEVVQPKSGFFSAEACPHPHLRFPFSNHGKVIKAPVGNIVMIPRGLCWLEVDKQLYPSTASNRSLPEDSNIFGPVPLGLITGRVLLTLNPPQLLKSKLTRDQMARVAFV